MVLITSALEKAFDVTNVITDDLVAEIQAFGKGHAVVGSSQHAALEKQVPFTCCSLLGKLIYTCVTGHHDVSCVVSFLARCATCPNENRCESLKCALRCIWSNMEDGLRFWRDFPHSDLPACQFNKATPANNEEELPPFPKLADLNALTGFVDTCHDSCMATRCSVTGIVFMLAVAAVAFESQLQPTSMECIDALINVVDAKNAKVLGWC